jgi:hypothetical protein
MKSKEKKVKLAETEGNGVTRWVSSEDPMYSVVTVVYNKMCFILEICLEYILRVLDLKKGNWEVMDVLISWLW